LLIIKVKNSQLVLSDFQTVDRSKSEFAPGEFSTKGSAGKGRLQSKPSIMGKKISASADKDAKSTGRGSGARGNIRPPR
jgi:hypothetical protein